LSAKSIDRGFDCCHKGDNGGVIGYIC
jgi:hypothetical protein